MGASCGAKPAAKAGERGETTAAGPETNRAASGSGAAQLIQNVRRSGWLAAGEDGPQPLDRQSPVPLYVQIRRRLLSLIAGWPDPAQRFYTDEETLQAFRRRANDRPCRDPGIRR